MIIVNAVDSFCNIKLINTTGHGEKKLYLNPKDSFNFIAPYLGITPINGHVTYSYNDEQRVRTLGLNGYILKENLQVFFKKTNSKYSITEQDKYRTNLNSQLNLNNNFLANAHDRIIFRLECSLSQNRIYVGSRDMNWHNTIPAFSFPRETKIRITNLNNNNEVRFELI